jgi:hypothetical protein
MQPTTGWYREPLPVPGWYPDPAGIAAYRWWDGEGWTEGTHAPIEIAPAREPARPAAQLAIEPAGSWDAAMQLFAEVKPVNPMAPVATAAPSTPVVTMSRRGTGPTKTRWSSLLAAFPVVYPIAVAMIVGLAYAGGAASQLQTLIVIAGVAAIGLLTPAWIFADHDRRELVARGYDPAPSIAWMLLLPPIAYLLARRRVLADA